MSPSQKDKYLAVANNTYYRGKPLKEMNKDDLLALLAWALEEKERIRANEVEQRKDFAEMLMEAARAKQLKEFM